MKKQNVRTLSLIVCTFTYLLIGAAVFDALESKTENQRKVVLQVRIGMSGNSELKNSKMRKAHKIGEELLLPAAKDTVTCMLGELDTIPLSNATVRRRIESMALNVKENLIAQVKNRDVTNYAQLMVYVRTINTNYRRAGGIFKKLNDFFAENELDWKQCVGFCSDGVRVMTEKFGEIQAIVRRKYNISDEDFRIMETIVLKSEPHRAGQQWKFTGAFYYATTVLTTIGYGHSTSTISGKLFTMFYAMIGIPLGLVMFQSIGGVNRLSRYVLFGYYGLKGHVELACNYPFREVFLTLSSNDSIELDLICVVTFLSSLTIAGGAAAFSRYEGWSYFDSVYYCFITLTTIGFGDMVALQKDNALSQKPEYVMFALIFILFSLAIVAASLNLLVLRFVTMNTEDERRDEAQAMQ
ncbi:hypothetical protein NQ314_004258, partial [Rhamnusium bicolor]